MFLLKKPGVPWKVENSLADWKSGRCVGARLVLVLHYHNYGLIFFLEVPVKVSVEDGGRECVSSGSCLFVLHT